MFGQSQVTLYTCRSLRHVFKVCLNVGYQHHNGGTSQGRWWYGEWDKYMIFRSQTYSQTTFSIEPIHKNSSCVTLCHDSHSKATTSNFLYTLVEDKHDISNFRLWIFYPCRKTFRSYLSIFCQWRIISN